MKNPMAMSPNKGLIHHGYLTLSIGQSCYVRGLTEETARPGGIRGEAQYLSTVRFA
jgi:hypothetical protein